MSDDEKIPKRDERHDALEVFLGDWAAKGQSFGNPDQPTDNPKSKPDPWKSTHTSRWHTGKFFLIQDERATVGGAPFDTLSIMGVDPESGGYFARGFENHGYYRNYDLLVDGRVWTLTGKTERARIEFSADGRNQTIVWEWKPADKWLPLCDRIATRRD